MQMNWKGIKLFPCVYTDSICLLSIKKTHFITEAIQISSRVPFILFCPGMFKLEFTFFPFKSDVHFRWKILDSLISKLISYYFFMYLLTWQQLEILRSQEQHSLCWNLMMNIEQF